MKPLWLIMAERDLERYGHRKATIQNLTDRLKYLASCTNLKSASLDKIPTQCGGTAFEDAILDNLVEKEIHTKTIAESKDLIRRAERALEGLSDREKKVLDIFYINKQNNAIDRLKKELNLSERQIYNIRDYAIHIFALRMYGKADA